MNREELIHNRLEQCIYEGEISNDAMVKIIATLSQYLGLQNLTQYAKHKGISIQAAKKHKNIISISGKYFAINNE